MSLHAPKIFARASANLSKNVILVEPRRHGLQAAAEVQRVKEVALRGQKGRLDSLDRCPRSEFDRIATSISLLISECSQQQRTVLGRGSEQGAMIGKRQRNQHAAPERR